MLIYQRVSVSVYGVPDMVATCRNDATADHNVYKLQQWTVDIKLVVSTPEITQESDSSGEICCFFLFTPKYTNVQTC